MVLLVLMFLTIKLIYRDSTTSKQIMSVFDELYKKHSKTISISSQSCGLMTDHTLPKLEVTDKESQEIVCHVFNFLDQMGGINEFNIQSKSDLFKRVFIIYLL